MLRMMEMRPVNSESTFRVRNGQPVGGLIIPYERFNHHIHNVSQHTACAIANVLYEVANQNVTCSERMFRHVVCIQIRKGDAHMVDSVQLEFVSTDRDRWCHVFALVVSSDGAPSERAVQTVAMLMWRYMSAETRASTMFFMGCLKGLNRTGFITCAVLHRLFGVPVRDGMAMFARAHYPGIVKQAFIRELIARYGGGGSDPSAPPPPSRRRWSSPLDSMPANFAVYNLINRELHTLTQDEEHDVAYVSGKALPVELPCPPARGPMQTSLVRNARNVAGVLRTSGGGGLLESCAPDDVLRWARSAWKTCVRGLDSSGEFRPIDPVFDESAFLRQFKEGFVKLVPCSTSRIEALPRDAGDTAMVSIKADGEHASLFIMPYGTYMVKRNPSAQMVAVPLWPKDAKNHGAFFPPLVLECEVVTVRAAAPSGAAVDSGAIVGIEMYAFDMLYKHGWKTSPVFSSRCAELEGFFNSIADGGAFARGADGVSIELLHKPFVPVTHVRDEKDLMSRAAFARLIDRDQFDGVVLSFAHVPVCMDKVFVHQKIKAKHTIDLIVKNGDGTPSGTELWCRDSCIWRQSPVAGASAGAPVISVLGHPRRIVAKRQEIDGLIQGMVYEFEVVALGGEGEAPSTTRLGLKVMRRRGDVESPNAFLTVVSCFECTVVKPMQLNDVISAFKRRQNKAPPATRKRRRDQTPP